MAEIKYQYAYDENGVLVNINTLSRDECKLHEYKCIGCGNTLTPRAIGSQYRKPHFYHKTLVDCNGETYLHKLGKLFIKKQFDESEHFYVSYPAELECSEMNCILRNPNCHKGAYEHNEVFDLKKYYDTCAEEESVNGFIADLLLTSSKNPNLEPVLIEIRVTHACEEEKKNSGLRIIEIRLKKESDLEQIFEDGVLKENYYYSEKQRDVDFISFKKKIIRKSIATLFRYIVNDFSQGIGFFQEIPCSSSLYKVREDSELELNVAWKKRMDYIPEVIPSMWLYRNKGYRRCNVCKFYGQSMYEDQSSCKYNAKYGRNPYPKMIDAESCRVFSVDSRLSIEDYKIEEVKAINPNAKPEYKVIIAGSSYICEDYEYFKKSCLKYLSQKMNTHEVILISGTANDIENMTKDFAAEYNLQIQPCKAEWDKYEDAAYKSNEQQVAYADALILFWDKRSRIMRHLLETAKKKGIKVAEPPIR